MGEYSQVWWNGANGNPRRRIYVSADPEGGWLVEAKQGSDTEPQRRWVVPDDKLPLLMADLMGPSAKDPNRGWREITSAYVHAGGPNPD